MGIFKEFKEFALRGNVVDMAIGIVIGGAFGGIVKSLVGDIVNPLIGVLGSADFSRYAFQLKHVEGGEPVLLRYGAFITVIINFLILALAVFVVIKITNTAKKHFEEEKELAPKKPSAEITLLTEIRDALQKR